MTIIILKTVSSLKPQFLPDLSHHIMLVILQVDLVRGIGVLDRVQKSVNKNILPIVITRRTATQLLTGRRLCIMASPHHEISHWSTPFIKLTSIDIPEPDCALIILNQPFSIELLNILWNNSRWHCCADGGANRLYDVFEHPEIQDNEQVRAQWIAVSLGCLFGMKTDCD